MVQERRHLSKNKSPGLWVATVTQDPFPVVTDPLVLPSAGHAKYFHHFSISKLSPAFLYASSPSILASLIALLIAVIRVYSRLFASIRVHSRYSRSIRVHSRYSVVLAISNRNCYRCSQDQGEVYHDSRKLPTSTGTNTHKIPSLAISIQQDSWAP